MNLFIDTNTFLAFYHLSSDDLEELKKLGVLIGQRRVKLFLPQQVIDEFRRNRENKIADALNRFSEEKLNNQFPQMCKSYGEYAKMRAAIEEYNKQKSKLKEKLRADIVAGCLKADEIISDLFSKASLIEVSDDILTKAQKRMIIGNPPGKNNSHGDAINWECLLAGVPADEDLFFITEDGDFASELDASEFSPFLQNEWKVSNGREIIFFNRLSAFFKNKFPDIRLASELEKELLITDLAASRNFATSRKLLKQIVKYGDFTDTQLNDIVQAAITNSQISWIAGDDDINEYLRTLIKGRQGDIEPDALQKFKEVIGEKPAPIQVPVDDDVPF